MRDQQRTYEANLLSKHTKRWVRIAHDITKNIAQPMETRIETLSSIKPTNPMNLKVMKRDPSHLTRTEGSRRRQLI